MRGCSHSVASSVATCNHFFSLVATVLPCLNRIDKGNSVCCSHCSHCSQKKRYTPPDREQDTQSAFQAGPTLWVSPMLERGHWLKSGYSGYSNSARFKNRIDKRIVTAKSVAKTPQKVATEWLQDAQNWLQAPIWRFKGEN
jgi:hypothetical protein